MNLGEDGLLQGRGRQLGQTQKLLWKPMLLVQTM